MNDGTVPQHKFDDLVAHAKHQIDIATAEVAKMRAALVDLVNHVEGITCRHEDIRRGGMIWTICDGCGAKWADDRGGFVPYKDAPALEAARTVLDITTKPQQPQATPSRYAGEDVQ